MTQPFNYEQIFFNDVIYYLETKWERKLTDHEKSVLIEGYRFGRLVESENEIRILDTSEALQLRLKIERYEKALREIEEFNEYYSGNIAGRALDEEAK